MKVFTIFTLLVAAATATPVATAGSPKSTATNDVTPAETVTDFRRPCVCPDPVIPPMLNSKSKCQMLAASKMACYLKSNGGCSKPDPSNC